MKASYEELRALVQSAMDGDWDKDKLKEKREEKQAKKNERKSDLIAEATDFLSRQKD